MPVIREYAPRVETQGPVITKRADAQEFGIGAGLMAAGQSISETAGALARRQGRSEVSDLNAKLSEAHADFTNQWNETLRTADPSDGTVAEKFMKDFDSHMQELGDSVSSRQARDYFTEASAKLRAHFSQTAVAGQAELAGVKAKDDYLNTLKNYSSGLIADPSSFNLVKDMHASGINQLVETGGLSREDAIKLKEHGDKELAKSAIRGWIGVDPDLAKQQISSGRWDTEIDGDTKYQMLGEATQGIHAKQIEAERQARAERDALVQKQMVTQDDFLKRMEAGKLGTKDILNSNLDAFGSGSKEQFLQLLNRHTSEKIRTDPGTFVNLWDRVHLPDGDPKKIVDENDLNQYMGRGLTAGDVQTLRGEIQNKRTAEGSIEAELKKGVMEVAKGALTKSNPMLGIKDPAGDEQMLKFSSFFLQEFQNQRKKGKSAIQLLSPDSPDYLGKYVRQYTRNPQQIMQDMIRMNVPANPSTEGLAGPGANPAVDSTLPSGAPNSSVAPNPGASPNVAPAQNPVVTKPAANARKPGESAADYLKRVGK